MAIYYISACHDCKEKIMWAKCTLETAKKLNSNFHKGHNTELSDDYDESFYDITFKYKHLGIK